MKHQHYLLLAFVVAIALVLNPIAVRGADGPVELLVSYWPTPSPVADAMMEMANVGPNDVVYELGCGEAHIAITAAKRGARVFCVELDADRILRAQANAEREGVWHRITFLQQDLFETDVSSATVVTLFLTRTANLKLREKFTRQLKPGARIVSHWHDMGDWEPDAVQEVSAKEIESGDVWRRPVYLWIADGVVRP